VVREPNIAQLDMGIFKNFKFNERFSAKFRWQVFNVFNHPMLAASFPSSLGGAGSLIGTADVVLALNPILATGAQRNMQFGISIEF